MDDVTQMDEQDFLFDLPTPMKHEVLDRWKSFLNAPKHGGWKPLVIAQEVPPLPHEEPVCCVPESYKKHLAKKLGQIFVYLNFYISMCVTSRTYDTV